MNKTIKKMVALGIGATMLAGTAAVATAATLADYPSPFVKDGAFAGKIVFGEKAAVADVIGAIDIATSLQVASSTPVTTGTSGTSASVEDGYLFDESEKLILGNELYDIIASVDDTELPELLASGSVEADDGTDYDYEVEIQFPTGANVVSADITDNDLDDEYSTPVVYYDISSTATPFYKILIDFDDDWDAETFIESETIELFGKQWTFDPNNDDADDVLTLFGSETELFVQKGTSSEITYEGTKYTIEVLGGNTQDNNAILRVNGETKTVKEGDSRTMLGLPIYVKDVFVDDSIASGADISVQLFVGSNKLELDTDGKVTLNGEELKEVTVVESPANDWVDVDSITFEVTPSKADNEVEYILPGTDYMDPVFGAFKFHFVGAEDLMENKELLELSRNGKKLDIKFQPDGGEETSFTLLDNDNVHDDFWVGSTLANMTEDEIFVYNEEVPVYNYGSVDQKKVITHLLQIDNIDYGNDTSHTDFEVEVSDLTTGQTYTLTKCQAISSKIPLYPQDSIGTPSQVTFSDDATCGDTAGVAYLPRIYTEAGARLIFLNNVTEITSAAQITTAETAGLLKFNISEDIESDDDSSTPVTYTVSASWEGSPDTEYNLAVSGLGSALDDDDDNSHYLTNYGTYVIAEEDDGGAYIRSYVPAKEVNYEMFLAPVESSVVVTQGTTGGAVAVTSIPPGMAIEDTEATLGSKPYIVVGGPCINTVAAALMGNPENCAEGFEAGKATIKLFSSQNALLVAGYSAKDTQGATKVLAQYKNYKDKFVGTELEVVTTNLNSLQVNKVQ